MTIYTPPGAGFPPTILTGVTTNAGNLGSAYTVNFTSTANTVEYVTGTLNANCTITFSNRAAGCQAYLFLSQDGTGGRTLSISDGTSSSVVSVPIAANAFFVVEVFCPDATNVDVVPVLGGPLPSSVVSVNQFLLPSGSDDSVAAATAIAAGGTIILGPGTFLWNTQVPSITRSTPTKIVGSGRGKTTVKLSASAPRFLDFHKVADNDTFSQITISDLTVDVNNTGGQNHKVLGTYMNSAVVNNVNFDRIMVERVEAINVPTPLSSTTPDHPFGIWIVPSAITQKGTGTQYNITNITIRDYRQTGGHGGVTVGGAETFGYTGDGSVNIFLDNIQLLDCWHDTGVLSTVATGDNFQIGSRAFGDRLLVERCVGLRGGDEGLEINGMSNVTVRDCLLTDALNDNVIQTNFAVPSNSERQVALWENVESRNTQRGATNFGFVFGTVGNSTAGIIRVKNCGYTNTTASPLTTSGEALLVGGGGFDRFELEGFTATYTAAAPSTAGTINSFPVRIGSVTAGGYIGVRDLRIKITSTKTGAGTYFIWGLSAGGPANTEIDIDGYVLDVENTLSAGILVATAVNIGSSLAWTGFGSWRRINPIYNGVSASTSNGGLLAGASWTPSGNLVISDCDFSGMSATATDVIISTAANIANVRTRAIRWRVYPKVAAAASATTFAAATFTTATGNQYIGLYGATISLANASGAGITAVDLSKDGSTYTNVWTQASGAMTQTVQFHVDAGDFVKITFATTQPTVTVIPDK